MKDIQKRRSVHNISYKNALLAFRFVRRDYEIYSYTQETDSSNFDVKYISILKDEVAKIKHLVYNLSINGKNTFH